MPFDVRCPFETKNCLLFPLRLVVSFPFRQWRSHPVKDTCEESPCHLQCADTKAMPARWSPFLDSKVVSCLAVREVCGDGGLCTSCASSVLLRQNLYMPLFILCSCQLSYSHFVPELYKVKDAFDCGLFGYLGDLLAGDRIRLKLA